MNYNLGKRYSLSAPSGIIAAALAIDSPVFGVFVPGNAGYRVMLERMRVQLTTIAAFTTPVTAGRRLTLHRFTGAALAGGSAIATVAAKRSRTKTTSVLESTNGGDARIATVGALTVAGVTVDGNPLALQMMSHLGAAGAYQDWQMNWEPDDREEIVLEPGEGLLIKNPVAMDAGGTWQLAVGMGWREVELTS